MAGYEVTLRFQFPAWDEKNGISYVVDAMSKKDAIQNARWNAKRDGHIPTTGKGRATFSAQLRQG